MDTDAILQLLNAGALLAMVVLYTKGQIVSRPIVDKILEEANNRTDKLTAEIKQGIKEAARDGIVEGLLIVKNNKSPQ